MASIERQDESASTEERL